MLKFCEEIESKGNRQNSERTKYVERFSDIVTWYSDIHAYYADRLEADLGNSKQQFDLGLPEQSKAYETAYEALAKESLFNRIEALFKLILSKYSYGPSIDFYNTCGIQRNHTFTPGKSWLDDESNIAILAETLARALKTFNVKYDFDIKALVADRKQRNNADHQAARIKCLSITRVYNSVRNMLVLLDPDCAEKLPLFKTNVMFDYEKLLQKPCEFGFGEAATVLIVDSVHDIREDYRDVISNLPWDLVVDFDGYSNCGGLLSSVSHNRIQREILRTLNSNSLPEPNPAHTLWCRCGEYLLPSYYLLQSFEIPEYTTFVSEEKEAKRQFIKMTTATIKNVLDKVNKLQKFINIVVLSDDVRIVQSAIGGLRDLECDDYYLSWIGLSDVAYRINDDYDNNEGLEYCETHFHYHFCPVSAFFETFYDYKSYWNPRESIKLNFALPGKNARFVPLSENDRNNLVPCFDVLYQDCETIDYPEIDTQVDRFLRGGPATWRDIASGDALPLVDLEDLYNEIKSTIGRIQEENPQQNLFFIKHRAGIGGTTIAKQLAWKLHNEIAVLEVKRYDDRKTFPLLQNLYDNIIGTNPILIVAEDTMLNIDTMCDEFLTTMNRRRCALLIACRESNGLYKKYPRSHFKTIQQLPDVSINSLKSRFSTISPLNKIESAEKVAQFDSTVFGDLRTPFIIGLYFIDKEFNVESYVKKVADGDRPQQHADMIALLAFCDKYNCKEISAAFVNKTLGFDLRKRSSLIQSCPGVESLICQGMKDNISVYYFKHPILSNQYLKMYTKEADSRAVLVKLAKYLISAVAKYIKEQKSDYMLDVLLKVIIQNKDFDDYEYAGNLSLLLTDIGMPESQRDLIQYLAEQFRSSADKTLSEKAIIEMSETDQKLLRVMSHAYAHLGKLYTRTPVNYDKAAQYLDLALKYMPYPDSIIYHMYGNALYHKMCDEWNTILTYEILTNEIPLSEYEDNVEKAYELFANTCEYGSPQFGVSGQLNLLYEYLRFLYKILGIKCKDDLKKLSAKQITFQTLFADTLEMAKEFDGFNEKTIRLIQIKEDQLRSEVLMGDYGKTVEYYQNQVDRLKNSEDIELWESALNGLVSARIRKAREEYASSNSDFNSLYQMVSDPMTLFDNITALLSQPYDRKSYSVYQKRCSLYHHWLQLAKLLHRPIEEALIQINYWIDAENAISWKKNPEPFYYKQALLYLDTLDGGRRLDDMREIRLAISRADKNQQFDQKRSKLTKRRDLLVVGTGMGRLLDISDCKNAEEISKRVISSKSTPMVLDGHFSSYNYTGAEFTIFNPINWNGEKARSEIGRMAKNSLSEQQLNHVVRFFAGLSTRGIYAINDSLKDQTTGELFDSSKIIESMCTVASQSSGTSTSSFHGSRKGSRNQENYQPSGLSQENNGEIGSHQVFHPNKIWSNRYSLLPEYLNGYIGDNLAGVSVKDLENFGSSEIEKHGGMLAVLNQLISVGETESVVLSRKQDADGGVKYTISLYQTMKSLSELLHGIQPIEQPSISKFTQIEQEEESPNFSGKTVLFIPDDNSFCKLSGTFIVDGRAYIGKLINVRSPKDKKKARGYGGKISATVQGKAQSGQFSIKMK
ncbi:P-loop NTPase [Clostridium minihomine]|uniref:P-loop NTPase n=1 Tax=Clostridium minihomine TaxID=2045012 RepID=UPI000C75FC62|nr:hypothetical protein [Clostridium minihomine]